MKIKLDLTKDKMNAALGISPERTVEMAKSYAEVLKKNLRAKGGLVGLINLTPSFCKNDNEIVFAMIKVGQAYDLYDTLQQAVSSDPLLIDTLDPK